MKNEFFYNARKINPNETRTISEFGIRKGEKIIVKDCQNLVNG